MRQRLIVLLPVRNAAADLPGLFDSVRPICDGIVALDDGSTDGSRDLLEREPLVRTVLINTVRTSYASWDDAANRNRLLEAAGAFAPDWVLSLDADERIDAADGAALRQFLETDALPGCAYGFRHIPMRETDGRYLPQEQWVYRLFAWAPGQRFPDQRLHFVPVPTDVPRALWVRTTLRIQHLGGMTDARRLDRFAKYIEADPARFFRADYHRLLAGPRPEDLRPWEPRPPSEPVLLSEAEAQRFGPLTEQDSPDVTPGDDPETTGAGEDEMPLSVVMISYNDERTIARTVSSIAGQVVSDPFEVIVVTSGSDRTAAIVREGFPGVRLIELPRRALPGEARNAGLRVASGTFVSFPGSHVELPPGSLQARLDAHRRGNPMVTGVAVNGNRTAAGWASYFIDHHAGLPGHRPARIAGPPAHCSYARRPLLEAGGFPEGVRSAEDTRVNQLLVSRGYVAFREPAIRFIHSSPCRTVRKLVSHHVTRGRGWGRLALARTPDDEPVIDHEFLRQRLTVHVPSWIARIDRGVARAEPELVDQYRTSRRLVLVGVVAGWAGMWFEILRPRHGKLTRLTGYRDLVILAIPAHDRAPARLLRFDLVTRHAQVLTLRSPIGAPAQRFERLASATLGWRGGPVLQPLSGLPADATWSPPLPGAGSSQPVEDQAPHQNASPNAHAPHRSPDHQSETLIGALGLTADIVLPGYWSLSRETDAEAIRPWRLIPRLLRGAGVQGSRPLLWWLTALTTLGRRFTVVRADIQVPATMPVAEVRRPRTRVPGQMSQ